MVFLAGGYQGLFSLSSTHRLNDIVPGKWRRYVIEYIQD